MVTVLSLSSAIGEEYSCLRRRKDLAELIAPPGVYAP
jgi:hypothetical protein